MKKLLLSLPLVAGAAWAGTSYYAGVQAETAYDNLLSQIGLDPMVFEKESFEKGLSKSQAVTVVRESHSPDAPVVFRLNHEINHAPIQSNDDGLQFASATIRTTFTEDSDSEKFNEFRALFKDDVPVEIITNAGVGGNIDSVVNVGAFEVKIDDDDNMMSIAKSSIDLKTTDGRTKGEGDLGAITMTDSNGITSTVASSELTFDVASGDYWKHGYEFLWSASELTVDSPDLPTPVVASNLSVGTDSVVNSNNLNQTVSIKIGQVDMGDVMPLDVAPVTSGSLDVVISELSLDALQSYIDWINQSSIAEQLELSEELSAELVTQLLSLVTKDIGLKYDLKLGNSGGEAQADYRVKFLGDDSPTGYDNIVTVSDLLNVLDIDLTVNADKSAIDMTPAAAFMQSPEAQMAFIDEGDQYTGKATLDGTTVDVNGNLFPLEDMLGGMLEMPLADLLESIY